MRSVIRNSIIDNHISKNDINNYNKLLSKKLKVDKEVLDVVFERSTKISKFLFYRKYKKPLWDHISKTIIYIKSLDDDQFNILLSVVNETIKIVNKDNIKVCDFIINIFKIMRDDENYYIGKYLNMFKVHLGEFNKLHIIKNVLINFWWALYVGEDKVKFNAEQNYNGKVIHISFEGISLVLDNNYSKKLVRRIPLILNTICGMVIDKINRLEYDKLEMYLSFIISTYDIKGINLVVEEQEDKITIVGKPCQQH